MADPRGSGSSVYRQASEGGADTNHTAHPTDEPLVYYQTAPSQYMATSPAPQSIHSSYPSVGAQNQQYPYVPGYPPAFGTAPGYPPAFGTAPMYHSSTQPQNPAYSTSAPQMSDYAHFRSLPPGPGVAGFSQTTGNTYSAVASQNAGPSPWSSAQSLPIAPYHANPQQTANRGWYAAVPQNTNFGHRAIAQYPTGPPYMTVPQAQYPPGAPYMSIPQAQNTGSYGTVPLNVNPAGRSAPPPQHPPVGTFVLYSPRRLTFSETSGRSGGAVRYKRPCLIHDIVEDSSQVRSLWIVPLTGTHNGKRKIGMNAQWWQPVKWHTDMIDAPMVPEDKCSVPTLSGSHRYINRPPISLTYRPPPPGFTKTQMGDKIPKLKPDYIWVGDIGEAIRLTDTTTTGIIMQSILSPYYEIRSQTISELHSEMMYWQTHGVPDHEPEDGIPDHWGIDYPPAPSRRG
ncbi:hypothetical protein CERSUDRAFT_96840 [Gelatoporia subvermispora B]|uniref:Uncharacterized protein n=1 Tax=Ceriporiopsis subvermispora (strain B) TaxID=914234 RepID=M2QD27_CERS8|nr:hypothetical protein CERSUDRAFT_96840 [Gelatoporia subvermispora B]